MKILITGFGRFGKNELNPTKEVLQLLPKSIYGNQLIKVELPVIFDECFDYLKPIIEDEKPDAIFLLGLAGGRTAITPERIAINLKDTKITDNLGNSPKDEEIIKNGKIAYYSTLPLRKMEDILKQKHIPVSISNSAGLFVCNNIMYHVLHYIDQGELDIKAGFVHVPFMDEQVEENKDIFSMPLETILEGVIDCIKTVIE
jgi:pyroglutamyl-peptidase